MLDQITVAPPGSTLKAVPASEADHPGQLNGIHDVLALVREVEHELPPIHLTFSPHDNARRAHFYSQLLALQIKAREMGLLSPSGDSYLSSVCVPRTQ